MLQYYIVDGLRQGRLEVSHFVRLTDAVRAYKALPAANWKALGVQDGNEAANLVLCLPLRPGEPCGEDVLDLGFLEQGGWKSKTGFMATVHELAVYLFIRYCLFQGCLVPVPEKDVLPRALRDKYLWSDVPGAFKTSIHWIDVAGVGRLSTAEFIRRYRSDEGTELFYPLVVRLGACGMTKHGRYTALEVTPWEFHLLAKRSQERLDQNKDHQGGI